MPHDRSRRDFLKKASYVPPILLSFHAAPSFARPGSLRTRPSQPGIQTLKPGIQEMNPTIVSSTEPAARPRSTDPGVREGRASRLDLRESKLDLSKAGDAASTGRADACEPVDDHRHGRSGAAAALSTDAINRTPRVPVGACSDESLGLPGADVLRGLSSKLWKPRG